MIGASAGVYTVVFMHASNLIINGDVMTAKRILISLALNLPLVGLIIYNIVELSINDDTETTNSYSGHLIGVFTALTLGLRFLRNFYEQKWEKSVRTWFYFAWLGVLAMLFLVQFKNFDIERIDVNAAGAAESTSDMFKFPSNKVGTFKRQGFWTNYWYEFVPQRMEEAVILDAGILAREAYYPDKLKAAKANNQPFPLKNGQITEMEFFQSIISGREEKGSNGFTALVTMHNGLKYLTVTFKGTEDMNDMMSNLDYTKNEFDIHTGFYNRIKTNGEIWLDQLAKLKKRHGSDIEDILFAGHSLGAAESTIAPYWLKQELNKIPNSETAANLKNLRFHVVHYAPPRAGGQKFAEEFNKIVTYFRGVMAAGDSVTGVPLIAQGYTHVADGLLIYPGVFSSAMARCDVKRGDTDEQAKICGMAASRYSQAVTASTTGSVVWHQGHSHSMDVYIPRVEDIFNTN